MDYPIMEFGSVRLRVNTDLGVTEVSVRGGPWQSTGTTLPDSGVTAAKLADGAVTASKVASDYTRRQRARALWWM
jgi:hypothetical protein